MPRLKKTEAQRRTERFGELYRVGKALRGLNEDDIISVLGIKSRKTLLEYRNHPDKFGIGQIAKLGDLFGWTDEEYMEIIHPKARIKKG